MKKIFILCCFIFLSEIVFCQQNNFKCPCAKIGLDAVWADSNKVTCYFIPVLKNTSNSSNGKFHIAAVVANSTKESHETPLLYLHGGPGIATIENVPRYLKMKTWSLLRERRPLVFFDYRGTGFSEPALCADMEDSLALFSRSNPSVEEKQSYKIALYKKCHAQLASAGIDITTFNSSQLADDAESIRKALQIPSWNIYGVSYGTTVGLNLLRNHRENISGIVLDSPFPPNAPWLDFIRPFESSFKVLEKNISADPVALSHFHSIRTDFINAVSRLNKNPVKIKNSNDAGEYDYTGDDFAWSIWTAMLNPKFIPLVPLAIQEVGNGNDSILTKWVEIFNDPNSFGLFSEPQSKAISCYEARPRSIEDTKASLLAKYPDFSSLYVDFEGELCDFWQPESAGPEMFEPVESNVPALVLSGEYDPVCPPLFGEITSQTLSNSTFIIVPAASHAAIHVDDCLRNMVDEFLSKPLKKPDVRCVKERSGIKFEVGDLGRLLLELK